MNVEQRKILRSFYLPFLFVAILWIIKIAENFTGIELGVLGVHPRHWEGLIGIITMPFIHAHYEHLISNSVPLLVLGSVLIYFYRESALKTFVLIYFLHSIWLWMAGRDSYHIGASGVVYGLASFVFVSGLIRRHTRLMAVSLLVVFLYGGMLWGIFPLFVGVSWEAHLTGSIAGILCAWAFRKEGLQRAEHDWGEEDDDINYQEGVIPETAAGETDNEVSKSVENNNPPIAGMPVIIHYDFKKASEEKKDDDKG